MVTMVTVGYHGLPWIRAEESTMIRSAVAIQYRSGTDGRTDKRKELL